VVIAIDVDKNFSLDEGRAQCRRIQAVKNRRKKRLRSFRILPEWDCHIAALAASVSKKARFGGFSFYLGMGFPSGRYKRSAGLRESERPFKSLPED
jgi:hypothetical protein